MSLERHDAEAAAVAKAPRVTLADIEEAVCTVSYMDGQKFLSHASVVHNTGKQAPFPPNLAAFTICMVVLKNGWIVTGKSAPASPENFDLQLGMKLAREDALRQVWGFMGFNLRDALHRRGA